LLVDDSEQWLRVERSIVQAIPGFCVIGEARDGLEAIEQSSKLSPDIVLLDIGMPLLNGIDAAQQIRKDSPSSRVVFVTQEQDAEIRDAALATGAEGFLLKANAVRELLPAVEAALRRPPDARNDAQFTRPLSRKYNPS
jgi:DNA-binding NarL/FixJ family response regulator